MSQFEYSRGIVKQGLVLAIIAGEKDRERDKGIERDKGRERERINKYLFKYMSNIERHRTTWDK